MTIFNENVSDVMKQAFIDYAMSVITDRALPDVRDGLKPVHRRILFAMQEAGNTYNKGYKKSARMVGDVIGKYHPHGDTSVYFAAVRMAQEFSMNVPLIEGQGNFGSIDGDNPAAMRYTEMRMARIAGEFFNDLEKETVEWRANYDGSEKEPKILPTSYPNLLVNGTDGIAVGMATAIPPHNLNSVIDATLHLMDFPQASTADIMGLMKAPDFPTGGLVHALDGFAQAIEDGNGAVKLRAKWHEEERGKNGVALIIDELPYQVNKADLVIRIADLVREKKIEDIANIRDESSKEGIRIWIALKKDASAEAVFSALCSQTSLEETFSYNCTVLVNEKPKQIGLKQIILEWLKFRQAVVLARYVFERKQAKAKLHILEGLSRALNELDAVIALIRGAESAALAKDELITLLCIDELQSQAILDMRLQKLTSMEKDVIMKDRADYIAKVDHLTTIIESPEKIDEIIKAELNDVAKHYGKARSTEIGNDISAITRDDLITREDVLLMMTKAGYMKRLPANALERQLRGTRGKKAMEINDDDDISFMQQVHSHDSLIVFAHSGQAYGIKAHKIPEGTLTNKGRHIRNVIDGLDEEVKAVVALPEQDPQTSVLTITKLGQVKRTGIDEYAGTTRKGGIKGVSIDEGDALLSASTVKDGDHIMLIANTGKAIRFEASEVREIGRQGGGVRGIKLDDDEFLIGSAVIKDGSNEGLSLFCIGEKGVGKRTKLEEFGTQARAGGGVFSFKTSKKTGSLVEACVVSEKNDLIMLASNGVSNRINVSDIPETGRATSGVYLMNVDEPNKVVSITISIRNEPDKSDEPSSCDAEKKEAEAS